MKDANPPFRPQLPKDLDTEIELLMKQCWNEDPEIRPTFDNIKNHLATVFKCVHFYLSVVQSTNLTSLI